MDYKNAQIYTIRSHQTEMVYVGSTCSPLYKRLYQHKRNYKNWLNKKYGYTASYEIVKFNDAYIELYEDYPCSSKRELNRREGQVMRETKNCVSKFIAGRSHKEWEKDNEKKLRQSRKEYYKNNKQQKLEYRKNYYEKNKQIINQISKNYYEKNKEKLKEQGKQYRKKNQEKIKEYEKKRGKTEKRKQQNKEYYQKKKNKKKFNSVLLEYMQTIEDLEELKNFNIRLDDEEYSNMMYKFKKYADDNTEKAKYHLETTANKTQFCDDVLNIIIGYL